MFKSRRIGLHLKVTLIISFILFLIFSGMSIFNTISMRNLSTDLSIKILEEISHDEARNISNFVEASFLNVNVMASSVQKLLDEGVRSRAYYEEFITSILKEFPDYIGAASITFEPNVFGLDSDYRDTKYRDALGRFSAYFERGSDNNINIRAFNEEELAGDYYTEPIQTGVRYLTDVYTFNVGGQDVSMYTWSLPLFIGNRTVGVITIDIFADHLKSDLLNSDILSFENSEYSLFTDTGKVVAASSNISYLGDNIVDIYPSYKNGNSFKKISQGETFRYRAPSSITLLPAIHLVRAVPVTEDRYWGFEVIATESVVLADANRASIVMIASSILSLIIVSFVISKVIKKRVTSFISMISKDMIRLSTGDISWQPPSQSLLIKDEIGDIARAVAKILEEFNTTVANVKNVSNEIESAANEVAQGNADLSVRTESQAAVLEETASSMEEMASTIKSSADHSMLGDKMMVESKESVSEAGDVISTTTNSIEDVLEASAKIKDITKIIEGIALQTNILALNAAVEAARAGEQGRGFAVVASEVRSLAQTTQTSVKSITELVANVDDKIKLATSSARKSKDLFTDIQGKIDGTAKIMQEISATAIEQQTGVNEINRAVTEMDIATQKNAALVEESTAAADALLTQARELVNTMKFFKTRDSSDITPTTSSISENVHKETTEEKYNHINITESKNTPDILANKISSPSIMPVSANKPLNTKNEFGSSLIESNEEIDEEFETF